MWYSKVFLQFFPTLQTFYIFFFKLHRMIIIFFTCQHLQNYIQDFIKYTNLYEPTILYYNLIINIPSASRFSQMRKFPLKRKPAQFDAQFYRNELAKKKSKIFHSLSNSFFSSVDKLSGSDADDKSVEAERWPMIYTRDYSRKPVIYDPARVSPSR